MVKRGKHARENIPSIDVAPEDVCFDDEVVAEDCQTSYATEAFEAVEEPQAATAEAVGGVAKEVSIDAEIERDAKNHKARRLAKKITLGVVGGLAGVYLIGVGIFSFLFFPSTVVGESDISFKSNADVAQMLTESAAAYTFTVEGQGVSLSMTSEEAGISYDTDAVTANMRSRLNAFAWPYEVFQEHDLSECAVVQYSNTALEDAIKESCKSINKKATPPKNATIGYSEEADAIAVLPEQYGTKIDETEVVEFVTSQNNLLVSEIVLPEEVLVEAEIRQDDERLAKAAEEANTYMTTDVSLTMGGKEVATIDAKSMAEWIVMDDKFQVSMSEELMDEWIDQVAEDCSTVGTERTYKRPDGKEVTVSGGDYGWDVDEDEFEELVRDAVENKKTGELAIPMEQEAKAYNGAGSADWGKRYIDVDISEQYARFYDKNGEIIWETDVVTGGPGAGRATPQGVWDLNANCGYTVLVGLKPDGEIDYETPVNYWMPFKGNSIGLHDASWRYGVFGGDIYTYDGSHGCVNLPPAKAKELHAIIEVGDVVITHY